MRVETHNPRMKRSPPRKAGDPQKISDPYQSTDISDQKESNQMLPIGIKDVSKKSPEESRDEAGDGFKG